MPQLTKNKHKKAKKKIFQLDKIAPTISSRLISRNPTNSY
ncbi:TPA: hypothetical protein QCR57_003886 [Bacillus cereus]|nr:hypothetical protein [Bacillus cereus]HDR4798223.1 hypothetical protein [Bacillus cereus]HDR4804311.1 hypothetical protein [Bacillus cereus]HDR4810319.1 hypothetical protein [Bacillus cereus]HDR4833713.1 hypothetical protein [Bacillus cereus]